MKKIIEKLKELQIKDCDLELCDGELTVWVRDGGVDMNWNMFSNNHLEVSISSTGSIGVRVLNGEMLTTLHPDRFEILSKLEVLKNKIINKRLDNLEKELKLSEEKVTYLREELGYEN